MNTLLSVRTNVMYGLDEKKTEEESVKEDYKKFTEIILLCDNPNYAMTNDREVIRKRGVKQLRFVVSEHALDVLIKNLLLIQGEKK